MNKMNRLMQLGLVCGVALLVMASGARPAQARWALLGYECTTGSSKHPVDNGAPLAVDFNPDSLPANHSKMDWPLTSSTDPYTTLLHEVNFLVGGAPGVAGTSEVTGSIAPIFQWVCDPGDPDGLVPPRQMGYVETSFAEALVIRHATPPPGAENYPLFEHDGATVHANDGILDPETPMAPQHILGVQPGPAYVRSQGTKVNWLNVSNPCYMRGDTRVISASVTYGADGRILDLWAWVNYSVQVLNPTVTVRRQYQDPPPIKPGMGSPFFGQSCTIGAGGSLGDIGEQVADVRVSTGVANIPYSILNPLVIIDHGSGLGGTPARFYPSGVANTDYAGNIVIGAIHSSDQITSLKVRLPFGHDATNPPASIYQKGMEAVRWEPQLPGWFKYDDPFDIKFYPTFSDQAAPLIPIGTHSMELETEQLDMYIWWKDDYQLYVITEADPHPEAIYLLKHLVQYSPARSFGDIFGEYKTTMTVPSDEKHHTRAVKLKVRDRSVFSADTNY